MPLPPLPPSHDLVAVPFPETLLDVRLDSHELGAIAYYLARVAESRRYSAAMLVRVQLPGDDTPHLDRMLERAVDEAAALDQLHARVVDAYESERDMRRVDDALGERLDGNAANHFWRWHLP